MGSGGWNRGLTKETDERVAKMSKGCLKYWQKHSPWSKGLFDGPFLEHFPPKSLIRYEIGRYKAQMKSPIIPLSRRRRIIYWFRILFLKIKLWMK